MTASMNAIVKRMSAKVSGLPDRVLLKSRPEHFACLIAWRDRTSSSSYEGRWAGPGRYRLSGYQDDRGYPVATVEFDSPPPQMTLSL